MRIDNTSQSNMNFSYLKNLLTDRLQRVEIVSFYVNTLRNNNESKALIKHSFLRPLEY